MIITENLYQHKKLCLFYILSFKLILLPSCKYFLFKYRAKSLLCWHDKYREFSDYMNGDTQILVNVDTKNPQEGVLYLHVLLFTSRISKGKDWVFSLTAPVIRVNKIRVMGKNFKNQCFGSISSDRVCWMYVNRVLHVVGPWRAHTTK